MRGAEEEEGEKVDGIQKNRQWSRSHECKQAKCSHIVAEGRLVYDEIAGIKDRMLRSIREGSYPILCLGGSDWAISRVLELQRTRNRTSSTDFGTR